MMCTSSLEMETTTTDPTIIDEEQQKLCPPQSSFFQNHPPPKSAPIFLLFNMPSVWILLLLCFMLLATIGSTMNNDLNTLQLGMYQFGQPQQQPQDSANNELYDNDYHYQEKNKHVGSSSSSSSPFSPRSSSSPPTHNTTATTKMTMNISSFNATTATNAPTPPVKITLDYDTARFLHVGKAGGGTFEMRIQRKWNVWMHPCHPFPCAHDDDDDPRDTHNNGLPEPFRFLLIRDPVDRLVSAFYYRMFELCHPDPQLRDQLNRQPGAHYSRHCKANHYPREANILFVKYQMNASKLAEAFCLHPQHAEADMREIRHAQFLIRDWLELDYEPDHYTAQNSGNSSLSSSSSFLWQEQLQRKAPTLVLLTLEQGAASLETQTDQSIEWLYEQLPFESADDFAYRKEYVAWRDAQEQAEAADHGGYTATHASHAEPLTAKGVSCLRQYFVQNKEYELYRQIQRTACKSDNCRQALELLLKRRDIH